MKYSCLKCSVPGGSVEKNPPANAGDMGSIPGSGRSPGKGNGNPIQYSCLENPMEGGACRLQSKESDTTERLHFQGSKILVLPGTAKKEKVTFG